jgi:hypothetical protein
MRRKPVIIIGSLVGICSFFLARSTPQRNSGLAYTLIIEERIGNVSGTASVIRSRFFARRSNGARASGPSGSDDGSQIREVILLAEGKSILISDLTRTKCTFYSQSPDRTTEAPKDTGGPNVQVEANCRKAANERAYLIGGETVLGIPAYRYDSRETDAQGQTEELARWLSPALGCRALREIGKKYGPGGSLIGQFERHAVQVLRGEPDDALFQVPEDYVEVRPSEQSLAILRAIDPERTPPPSWFGTLHRLDQRYESMQRR